MCKWCVNFAFAERGRIVGLGWGGFWWSRGVKVGSKPSEGFFFCMHQAEGLSFAEGFEEGADLGAWLEV